jgi:hypothetical protein
MKSLFVVCLCAGFLVYPARGETRTAQDMAKECRVGLDVVDGHAEKSFENVLFTGECICGPISTSTITDHNELRVRFCSFYSESGSASSAHEQEASLPHLT